jgi:hypothetical protein
MRRRQPPICYGELGVRVAMPADRRSTSAAALEIPVAGSGWAPHPVDLAALGTAGRAVVKALLAWYDFAALEGSC